jgi:hypothetical protein
MTPATNKRNQPASPALTPSTTTPAPASLDDPTLPDATPFTRVERKARRQTKKQHTTTNTEPPGGFPSSPIRRYLHPITLPPGSRPATPPTENATEERILPAIPDTMDTTPTGTPAKQAGGPQTP